MKKKHILNSFLLTLLISIIFITAIKVNLESKSAQKVNTLIQFINTNLSKNSPYAAAKDLSYFIQSFNISCLSFGSKKIQILKIDCDNNLSFFSSRFNKTISNNGTYILDVSFKEHTDTLLFYLLLFIMLSILIYFLQYINSLRLLSINDKYELALKVSHDIRSPVESLKSIAKNINEEIFSKSVIRIEQIANELLNYERSKITTKQNINSSIIDTIHLKKVEFPKVKITHSFLNFELFHKISIPTVQLSSILSNLINNSIDAKANQIEVLANIVNGNIILTIKDNGEGFKNNILDQVGSSKVSFNKHNGNGLGLFTAKKVLEEYNSLINFSNHKNGALVEIVLPIISNYILIDDDQLVRKIWEKSFKDCNLTIQSYKTTQDARNKLNNLSTEKTYIFIDSNLNNDEKGEDFARELFDTGFKNIFLETGHSPNKFNHLSFIKKVISKTPPLGQLIS